MSNANVIPNTKSADQAAWNHDHDQLHCLDCGWFGLRKETYYEWSSDEGGYYQCPECACILEDI